MGEARESNLIMKLFVLAQTFLTFTHAQTVSCYWDHGTSGQNQKCLPDFYIKGGCESGSRSDCRIDGKKASFGVKCCPADNSVPLTNRDEENCTWTMLNSGKSIDCAIKKQGEYPEQEQYNEHYTAMGRCSSSVGHENGGDCASKQMNNRSHGVFCCETDGRKDVSSCGWIYTTYGVKSECPRGFAVAGYCGVNNKGNCPQDSFLGIQCC